MVDVVSRLAIDCGLILGGLGFAAWCVSVVRRLRRMSFPSWWRLALAWLGLVLGFAIALYGAWRIA